MGKRALVCGAGISGLSAGILLLQMGWDVTVFEKDDELRVAGAGLNLWPNGVRVLKELGLGPQYERISASLDYYRTYSSNGEVVAVDDLRDWPDRYGAALSGVYRRWILAECLSLPSDRSVSAWTTGRPYRTDRKGQVLVRQWRNGGRRSLDRGRRYSVRRAYILVWLPGLHLGRPGALAGTIRTRQS